MWHKNATYCKISKTTATRGVLEKIIVSRQHLKNGESWKNTAPQKCNTSQGHNSSPAPSATEYLGNTTQPCKNAAGWWVFEKIVSLVKKNLRHKNTTHWKNHPFTTGDFNGILTIFWENWISSLQLWVGEAGGGHLRLKVNKRLSMGRI